MRNFEGFITTYRQPSDYQSHDPSRCLACQARKKEEGQEGVAGLLTGDRMSIVPEGFERVHQRLTRIRWRPIKQALADQQEDE